MEQITSRENQRIRHLILLNEKARKRRQEGLFVIEGKRIVLDAPKDALVELYLSKSQAEEYESPLCTGL